MTAYCSPSWTSWLIKTYFSSKSFFFMPESKLYTQPIALLLKKNIYGLWKFRRFRGLLIYSFVTPKNMEKFSQNFGDQPSRFKLCRSFIWALRFDTRFIRLKCELKRNIFFLWIAHFTFFSSIYSSVALRITRLRKFSEGHF